MNTNTMSIPNQPVTLAEYLGVNLEALRKMMKNKQLIEGRFSRYAELEPETVETLVGIYKPEGESGNGKAEVGKRKAESGIGKVEVGSEKVESGISEIGKWNSGNTESEVSKETESKIGRGKTEKPGSEIRERKAEVTEQETENAIAPTGTLVQALLLLVALASMYVQMDHTAQVIIADREAVSGYNLAKAWMFAFGVQFTGLSMSLFKGNQWYLRGYALADFIINLLYYQPWVKNSVEMWTQSLLLSALLVLTIFSYTQIATGFLKAKKRNDE